RAAVAVCAPPFLAFASFEQTLLRRLARREELLPCAVAAGDRRRAEQLAGRAAELVGAVRDVGDVLAAPQDLAGRVIVDVLAGLAAAVVAGGPRDPGVVE